jgi:hypothetical protein
MEKNKDEGYARWGLSSNVLRTGILRKKVTVKSAEIRVHEIPVEKILNDSGQVVRPPVLVV